MHNQLLKKFKLRDIFIQLRLFKRTKEQLLMKKALFAFQ